MVLVLGIKNAALLHQMAASNIMDQTALKQLFVIIQFSPPLICDTLAERLDYPAGITAAPGTGGESDDRVLRRGRDARVDDRPLQPILDKILLFLRA